jgi:multidrug resistance efflux pump
MPRPRNPLVAQIHALEQHLKDERKERRVTEGPLRKARSVLRDRLRKLKGNLTNAEASRKRMLSPFWIASEDSARIVHGKQWHDNAASIARFKAEIASTELDLELFASQHPELT